VALGTVADLAPLLGENRLLVARGLHRLRRTRRPGLRALRDADLLLLEQRRADFSQRSISASDLGRNIKANIVQALASLRAAAEQVRRAAEAVAAYGNTITSEDERYRAGESSLLDSILTQDQQTTALVTYAQARQQYASLLARLRYETGTLLGDSGEAMVVRPENILTLPSAPPAK